MPTPAASLRLASTTSLASRLLETSEPWSTTPAISTASASGDAYFGGSIVATGVDAYALGGDAALINAGNITATADGYSYSGDITATGANVTAYNSDASITNAGTISATAGGYAYGGDVAATGVYAGSYNYDATVTNSGSIAATVTGFGTAGSEATGVYVYSYNGSAAVAKQRNHCRRQHL